MRVVAGSWRGRTLKSPRGDAVRPTTDRVKEALFSILGPGVAGSVFVDLCCGSGGLGIEALSRGAQKAIFVDQSGVSLSLARQNLELCGATEGTHELVRSDCLRWLGDWLPPAGGWFLAADPPYRSELASAILEQMVRLASEDGFRMAVLEHGSPVELVAEDGPGPGVKLEARRFGQSTLTILRPGGLGP